MQALKNNVKNERDSLFTLFVGRLQVGVQGRMNTEQIEELEMTRQEVKGKEDNIRYASSMFLFLRIHFQ